MKLARLILIGAFVVAMLSQATTVAVAQATPADLQVVPILTHGQLTLGLRFKQRASLADVDWLIVEFENTGDEPIEIKNLNYWIECSTDNLKTRVPVSSSSLASGNDFDLFPEAWKTSPVAPRLVAGKTTHAVADQPSDYSAALLGLPPEDGFWVRATFHIRIELADYTWIGTAEAGVPFAFEWQYPNEAGFNRMCTRAKTLLATPKCTRRGAYILGALLDVPQVASAITRDDLLAGLALRADFAWDREAIARHVTTRFGADPTVIKFYIQQFEQGSFEAVSDLRFGLWHPSFVEPLVRLVESRRSAAARPSLDALDRHSQDWRHDATIVDRLFEGVRKGAARGLQVVAEVKDEDICGWASAVRDLTMTGHPSMIQVLRPALDDKRVYQRARDFATLGNWIPPFRVCDAALDGILRVLDENLDAAYRAAGLSPHQRLETSVVDSIRDQMIVDVKHRLDNMEH